MKKRILISIGVLMIIAGVASAVQWWTGDDDPAKNNKPDAPQTKVEIADEPKTAPPPKQKAETLALNLKVGDRFPLLKTVKQSLTQSSLQGLIKNGSEIELMLEIEVEDVTDDGRKLLSVKYHRVRYTQDIAGRKVDYRSDTHEGPVPIEALPYQGLLGNGFSFWLGPDNKIIEAVGFDQFVQRCVRNVPEEMQQGVLAKFAADSGNEIIANFVDDSIGLLPYNVSSAESGPTVRVGDEWSRTREIREPMAIQLQTRFTLKELTAAMAEIDILGTIGPSTTESPVQPVSSEVQIHVKGGHSLGSCTIDRKTGLPIKSQVRRYLDMVVRLPDGSEFLQRKEVATTIRAFPAQGTGTLAPSTSEGPFRP